jgi:hypothetical protein
LYGGTKNIRIVGIKALAGKGCVGFDFGRGNGTVYGPI